MDAVRQNSSNVKNWKLESWKLSQNLIEKLTKSLLSRYIQFFKVLCISKFIIMNNTNTAKKVDWTKDSNESQLSPKRLFASSNESQLNSKRLFANESPFKEENLRTKSRALLTVNERIPKDYKNSVLRPRKLPKANTSRNISKSSVRQKRPSKNSSIDDSTWS